MPAIAAVIALTGARTPVTLHAHRDILVVEGVSTLILIVYLALAKPAIVFLTARNGNEPFFAFV